MLRAFLLFPRADFISDTRTPIEEALERKQLCLTSLKIKLEIFPTHDIKISNYGSKSLSLSNRVINEIDEALRNFTQITGWFRFRLHLIIIILLKSSSVVNRTFVQIQFSPGEGIYSNIYSNIYRAKTNLFNN